MNAGKMLTKCLKDKGYDGLVNENMACGCMLDDLIPCEWGMSYYCVPAYRHDSDEYEWVMKTVKPTNHTKD